MRGRCGLLLLLALFLANAWGMNVKYWPTTYFTTTEYHKAFVFEAQPDKVCYFSFVVWIQAVVRS